MEIPRRKEKTSAALTMLTLIIAVSFGLSIFPERPLGVPRKLAEQMPVSGQPPDPITNIFIV